MLDENAYDAFVAYEWVTEYEEGGAEDEDEIEDDGDDGGDEEEEDDKEDDKEDVIMENEEEEKEGEVESLGMEGAWSSTILVLLQGTYGDTCGTLRAASAGYVGD
ncbi:hypothetical protein HK097_000756 [Rhizophlyctis rosea]|uniref:Uncharacterized protein n=1 Tax=Rhizophlyctis rosea TaxID=64517 RepID=A0AAD5S581_9FUNG|nr:hypothetical protein HK097_000756 [Rhizophlyctis rosea]